MKRSLLLLCMSALASWPARSSSRLHPARPIQRHQPRPLRRIELDLEHAACRSVQPVHNTAARQQRQCDTTASG